MQGNLLKWVQGNLLKWVQENLLKCVNLPTNALTGEEKTKEHGNEKVSAGERKENEYENLRQYQNEGKVYEYQNEGKVYENDKVFEEKVSLSGPWY